MGLIPSEDLLFSENTMILGRNLVFVREFQTIFFVLIVKPIENHDLGKCHKIRVKLHCPPQIFLAGTRMHRQHQFRIYLWVPRYSLKISKSQNYVFLNCICKMMKLKLYDMKLGSDNKKM